MTEWINALLEWVGLHPHLSGLAVGLLAFSESLAGVGLIVPGALGMFGFGALIATGAIDFWSVYAWATAGAVAGDWLSYWLGRRYHQQIRNRWPFRRHAEWLGQGEAFFRRHGGKSVFLGRYLGPLRPVIPVVAGMLDMPAGRFLLIDMVASLGWAPLYLLPGMAFGASLALAGEVAGRLALLVVLLVASGWLLFSLSRVLYRWFHDAAAHWAGRLLAFSRRHPTMRWLIGDLLDPARPAFRALLMWLVLLVLGSWLFWEMADAVMAQNPMIAAGNSVYEFLQQLRTPFGDRVMVIFSELGDAAVLVPLVAAVLVWMLWRRAWVDVGYWLSAALFGTLAVAVIKGLMKAPRPTDLYTGVDAYSFPSGHATMSTVIYGLLAVLIAQTDPFRLRWVPYGMAAVLIGGIAFSRLYLGAHWLPDVIAGVGLGAAWVALLAIARQRHVHPDWRLPGLVAVAALVWIAAGTWHVSSRLEADLQRYAVHQTVRVMSLAEWWRGGWRELPAHRTDLAGSEKQPLNLQWNGDLQVIGAQLETEGWQPPVELNLANAFRWLLAEPMLEALPLLPQVHDGHYPALILTHASGDEGQMMVLRLWPSGTTTGAAGGQVWQGSVSRFALARLPLLQVPRAVAVVGEDSGMLAEAFTGFCRRWAVSEMPVLLAFDPAGRGEGCL
ncbi:MAG: VTT domain-containing protein [Pseudomonadota bacterium]|nr:VTT domain-containing protein [Pseudomonadota bacterium]